MTSTQPTTPPRSRALLDDAPRDSPLLLNSVAAPSPRRREAAPRLHPALGGYLAGQLSAACTFGIWWVLSSPIFIAIFDKFGVGLMRLFYNAALFLCSPIAGHLVEKLRIRSVLCFTTATRALIYAIALPVVWLLLKSPLLPLYTWDGAETALRAAVLALVFVDGLAVSLANVAAIDCGGSDLVAQESGAEIDDNVRNLFNARHQAVFDGSMLLLSPALAFGTFFAGRAWRTGGDPPDAANATDVAAANASATAAAELVGAADGDGGAAGLVSGTADAQTLVLIAALGGAFACLSAFSLACYVSRLPAKPKPPPQADGGAPPAGLCAGLLGALRSLPGDAAIVWRHRPVFWRIVFLGLETALEDAMVALIIPELCLHGLAQSHEDLTIGSLQAAVAVAVGKVGAIVAAAAMSYAGPAHSAGEEGAPLVVRRWLFHVACLGGLSALGAPAVLELLPAPAAPGAPPPSLRAALLSPALGVLCAVSFCFFLLTTLPKIGFATLLQSLAAQADASGRVFGFVASFVTMCDAAVMLGLSLLFGTLPLKTALWAASGCFAAVGILEGTLGRYLVSERRVHAEAYVPYQGA